MSSRSLPPTSGRTVRIQTTMTSANITSTTNVLLRIRQLGRLAAQGEQHHHVSAFQSFPLHHKQAASCISSSIRVSRSIRRPFLLAPLHAIGKNKHSGSTNKNKLKERPQQSNNSDDDSSNGNAKFIATLSVAGGLAILIAGGYLLKDQIKSFLDLFIQLVDDWGPLGYVAYIGVYALLELFAVPAIPLTMTAGVIFGVGAGTAVVSVAATMAATGAFLIARYIARDKIAAWAEKNPKFAAIDRAIGKDGFRVVALLRLSPLLPLAASNYLYGLTSVDLGSYVLASWVGMLPGTLAYVAAGTYGRELMLGLTDVATGGGGSGGMVQPWQVALAAGVSGIAVWYVGRLATKALAELEEEEQGSSGN
ncbi:hypothetical protein Ndes2526A_g00520 [Nannochloris sp. 'desiccata']